MAQAEPMRWILLIHVLPARPLYLRARIRQMLARSGAAPLKQAVYALPATGDARARLERIATEIHAHGATAHVCEATFTEPADDAALVRALTLQSAAEYRRLAEPLRAERRRARAGRTAGVPARVARLRQRFEAVRANDAFAAAGGDEIAALLADLERTLDPAPARAGRRPWTGLTWVTRRGIHVDRIACAWAVRRFVDPSARFRFVSAASHAPKPGEIGFDVEGGEITHEDGGCSMESLLRHTGLTDPALGRIAEVVHDLDLKDGRHGHPETAGIGQLLQGVVVAHPSDDARLERGGALLDDLYASLTRRAPTLGAVPAARRSRRMEP